MPPAARRGDPGKIHCSSYVIADGSPDVFINQRPAARVGDKSTWHLRPGFPLCRPHTAKINSGSGSVRINGVPAARVGSSLSSCTQVAQGSPDVEIGGPESGGSGLGTRILDAGQTALSVYQVASIFG